MRKSILGAAAVSLLALGACSEAVDVTNYNNPDVERVFSTPAGVESFMGGLGVQANNPMRATESVNTQAKVLAGESFASVANFGMAARAVIPRSIISNELGNDNQGGNNANFNSFGRLSRVTMVAMNRLDQLIAAGAIYPAADYARLKAFAFLISGLTLGNLSLAYDSAAIVVPTTPDPGVETAPLSHYTAVNQAALNQLDSAILYSATMSTTPASWINRPSGAGMTGADLARLARSYKARFRAGVARDPAENAAVDWNAVITDASAGITADHEVQLGGGSGWSAVFDVQQSYVAGGWHSWPMMYTGGADTSGGFNTWLATADPNARRAFLVVTPDLRWPQGTTRALQQNATNRVGGTSNIVPVGPRYIINRSAGNDIVNASWGESYYDHRRWGSTQSNSATGPYADFTLAENNLLLAEAYIRTAQPALAVPLINATRSANGLPDVTVAGAPTLGGPNSCIPKMPIGGVLTCGDLLESLKYEKRMETAMTGYMVWFTDSRRWGDLVQGTVVEWPVPYQEFQARGRLSGFPNGERRAGPSTYGY